MSLAAQLAEVHNDLWSLLPVRSVWLHISPSFALSEVTLASELVVRVMAQMHCTVMHCLEIYSFLMLDCANLKKKQIFIVTRRGSRVCSRPS